MYYSHIHQSQCLLDDAVARRCHARRPLRRHRTQRSLSPRTASSTSLAAVIEADDEKELAATLRGANFAPGAADDGVAVGLLNRGAALKAEESIVTVFPVNICMKI